MLEGRAAFAALWAFMAERYPDNPLVRFSIMNEPFCLVTIPDGKTAEHLAESYSAFMEDVVDAIRQAGATRHKVHVDKPFLWDAGGNLAVRSGGELVIYEERGGRVRLEVRLEGDTLWLSLAQMA